MNMSSWGGVSAIFLQGGLLSEPVRIPLVISYPYEVNQSDSRETNVIPPPEFSPEDDTMLPVTTQWNGLNLSLGGGIQPATVHFLTWANGPMELAKGIYFVPLRRGFVSPMYGVTNVTQMFNTDSEVASLLATDRYLGYKVSDYMEVVADRQLHARAQIGTSSFTLDSVPRNRDETPVSIVNEGFGVNQVAYMLTVALYDKAKIVLIEEPEIHLHPSMVRKLVHAFVDIVSNSDRRFVISTHSETFVVALLAQIAVGKISVDNVSFILAEKENGESKFTKQEAKSNGQIQGGLESFIASEFAFLGLNAETAQS